MEHNFKRLNIWQKSIELVYSVYDLTNSFPKDERFGLTSQLRRSAISIPSNIAEGSCRESNKHFSHYLGIATGSLYELHTQLVISKNLDFISKEQLDSISLNILKIDKMLYTFNKKILAS